MEEIKNKFNALVPKVLEKNEPIYTEALDYAFSNDDIKNIAITGIFGAGKSTVWNTYANDREIKNIITVSLGKYEDDYILEELYDEEKTSGDDTFQADGSTSTLNNEGTVNGKNDSDGNNVRTQKSKKDNAKKGNIDKDNRVERQLINQMLSQIKEKNIPFSKYKFKANKSCKKIFFQVIAFLSIIASILLLIIREPVIESIREINKDFKSIFFVGGCIGLFLVPLFYFFYLLCRNNRLKISKINIKGTEADLNENENWC